MRLSLRVVLATAVVSTTLLAGAARTSAQSEPTAVTLGLAEAYERLEAAPAGAVFEPAADPNVPDLGRPNAILEKSSVTLSIGRLLTGDDLDVDLPVEQLNAGSEMFGANQQTLTVAMVVLARPPEQGGNLVDNLSVAFSYSGEVGLVASPFSNDPLLGLANVIDRGVVDGESFTSYQRIVDDAWTPAADPIGTYAFETDKGYVVAWLIPGAPERMAAISSHAAQAVAEALYFAKVDFPPATEFIDPATITSVDALENALIAPSESDAPELSGWCGPLGEESGDVCDVSGVGGGACVDAGGSSNGESCGLSEAPGEPQCVALGDGFEWTGSFCSKLAGESIESGGADTAEIGGWCGPLGDDLGDGICAVPGVDVGVCAEAGGTGGGDESCGFRQPLSETDCSSAEWIWDSGLELCTATSAPVVVIESSDDLGRDDQDSGQDDQGAGGNDQGEGSSNWLVILLGASAVALIGAYLVWRIWLRGKFVQSPPTPEPASVEADSWVSRRGAGGHQHDGALLAGEAIREGAPCDDDKAWYAPSNAALRQAEWSAQTPDNKYWDNPGHQTWLTEWSKRFVNVETGEVLVAGPRWEAMRTAFGLDPVEPDLVEPDPVETNPTIEFPGNDQIPPA